MALQQVGQGVDTSRSAARVNRALKVLPEGVSSPAAHTDADMARILEAAEASLLALRADGAFAGL